MNNSYLVSFADLEDEKVWIKRFEGNSFSKIQDKIRSYVEELYDLGDELPDNYNEMKAYVADTYYLLIGSIEDLETI